jgi:hypothetical protein
MLDVAAYQGASNEMRIQALQAPLPPRLALRPENRARGLTVVILNLNRPDLIVPLLRRLASSEKGHLRAREKIWRARLHLRQPSRLKWRQKPMRQR